MKIYEEIIRSVEENRALILDAMDYIWKNPETGYREWKTAAYLERVFEQLGYELQRAGEIPGFTAELDTGRPGPGILILGELDALLCRQHPDADPETGAVHICGHHAQCAALVGVAAALRDPKITESLCGKIRFCAVPAEELIEIEYRSQLREKGIIRYLGGKSEFMRRGFFDGCDLAFLVHTTEDREFSVNVGSVGMCSKIVEYKGKSAHAGGSPWEGINALYAASLGLQAVNSIRETFQEKDIIRVHPIMTNGGTAVNAIPEKTRLEAYVRGKTVEAIREANKKVNRALCGAALSLGAGIEIRDCICYFPLNNEGKLIELAGEALEQVLPGERFVPTGRYSSGSTDMGDLSAVMPVIQPYAPGAEGVAHGDDYRIAHPELAGVASAKWQLALLFLLLEEGGRRAWEIKESYRAPYPSKEAFLQMLDESNRSGARIAYQGDKAEVTLD